MNEPISPDVDITPGASIVSAIPLPEPPPAKKPLSFEQKLQIWELVYKVLTVIGAVVAAAKMYSDVSDRQMSHQKELADAQRQVEQDRITQLNEIEKMRWDREKLTAQQRKMFGLEQYKKKMELYHDACRIAATIATARDRFNAEDDIRRFGVLYHGNLCMVENDAVVRAQTEFYMAVDKWREGPPTGLFKLSQDLARSCRQHLDLLDEESRDQYYGEALNRLQRLADERKVRVREGELNKKYLKDNETLEFQTKIAKGREYWLLAAGDRDVDELNVKVLDQKGKPLPSIPTASKSARDVDLLVRTAVDQTCTIQVTLKKCRDQVNCMCVAAVLEK